VTATAQHDGFQHEVIFFEGAAGFVAGVGGFIRDGLEHDEAVLVAVSADKTDILRTALGASAKPIRFVDITDVGSNPARILPMWSDFVAEQTAAGRAFRGVGEPVWGSGSSEELAECARHEALLNLAFADTGVWRLACPYDRAELEPSIQDGARRTHPIITSDGTRELSDRFLGTHAAELPFTDPLTDPGAPTRTLEFEGPDDMRRVRSLVREIARASGLDRARVDDLALATDEVAANSLRHGGGRGVLRVWRQERALICEVADPGHFDAPLAGRQRPKADHASGMGLWIANQVCDLVQVRSTPEGTVVRLRMQL